VPLAPVLFLADVGVSVSFAYPLSERYQNGSPLARRKLSKGALEQLVREPRAVLPLNLIPAQPFGLGWSGKLRPDAC